MTRLVAAFTFAPPVPSRQRWPATWGAMSKQSICPVWCTSATCAETSQLKHGKLCWAIWGKNMESHNTSHRSLGTKSLCMTCTGRTLYRLNCVFCQNWMIGLRTRWCWFRMNLANPAGGASTVGNSGWKRQNANDTLSHTSRPPASRAVSVPLWMCSRIGQVWMLIC